MYGVTIKDVQGFVKYLSDKDGRLYAFNRESDAHKCLLDLSVKIINRMEEKEYIISSYFFGVFSKKIESSMTHDLSYKLHRWKSSMNVTQVPHGVIYTEEFNLG